MESKIKGISFELLKNVSENISFETIEYIQHVELLNENLGERQKDITSVICLIGVYIIIFITGIIGNVSMCFVICEIVQIVTYLVWQYRIYLSLQ
jgi:hypothetical protein